MATITVKLSISIYGVLPEDKKTLSITIKNQPEVNVLLFHVCGNDLILQLCSYLEVVYVPREPILYRTRYHKVTSREVT